MIKSIFIIISLGILILSPFFGAISLDIDDILTLDSISNNVFFSLRVPRVIFAFFAGGILALCGLLYQTLFRNPLMTPYTLGISSGAVLGAGIGIKLGLGILLFGFTFVGLFSFVGAIFSIFLLLYLAKFLNSSSNNTLLLLGIALSLFYSSALMVVFYIGSPIQNDTLIRFTMGSLSILGYKEPLMLGFMWVLLVSVVFAYRYELQIINISSEFATLKGVDVKKTTTVLLFISSLAIAMLVSISGPIGFVGLVVPHIVSKIYPTTINHKILKTTLFGGVFLVFCDTISRVIQTQSELPIGIVTAFLGGPFFVYLIISRAKN